MKTLNEIRADLRQISYYYSKQKDLENALKYVGSPTVLKLVEQYNTIIQKAPVRFYDLYVALHVNNNTQIVVAEDWGLSQDYIRKLNRKLCDYFYNEFNKENEK